MGLEVGTYISDLVVTNPVGASDAKSQGDDHLRLIKATIKNTFPNITGAMTLTHAQLNQAALKNVSQTFTASQTIQANNPVLFLNGTGNAAISLGRTDNVASTPFIDFHSGTDGTNGFDVRVIASGGTTSDGQGTLNVQAAALQLNGVPVVTSVPATFPAGTRLTFQQTSAPTGWTKELTHNNKAMRLVTGSVTTGGTVAFTTAFASKSVAGTINNVTVTGTVQNHTLTIAQLPSHDHGASGLTFTGNALGGHSHGNDNGTGFLISGPDNGPANNSGATGSNTAFFQISSTSSVSAGTPSGSIGGTTASTGSGSAHNHGLVMDSHGHTFTGTAIDLAVQYVDFIIAVKD